MSLLSRYLTRSVAFAFFFLLVLLLLLLLLTLLHRALMQFASANSDLLMFAPSVSRIPEFCVRAARSDLSGGGKGGGGGGGVGGGGWWWVSGAVVEAEWCCSE